MGRLVKSLMEKAGHMKRMDEYDGWRNEGEEEEEDAA